MTPRDDLRALADIAECAHDNRTGGNDYIECTDCGLMWDYRKPGWHSNHGPRRELAARLRALAAAQETPQDGTEAQRLVILQLREALKAKDRELANNCEQYEIELSRARRMAHETPAPRPAEERWRLESAWGMGYILSAERTPAPPATLICASCAVPDDGYAFCLHCGGDVFRPAPGGPTP